MSLTPTVTPQIQWDDEPGSAQAQAPKTRVQMQDGTAFHVAGSTPTPSPSPSSSPISSSPQIQWDDETTKPPAPRGFDEAHPLVSKLLDSLSFSPPEEPKKEPAPQIQWDDHAAISPRGNSFVEKLEDAKNKLLYEGVPSIGLQPLTSGVSQQTAETMGSPLLGPVQAAKGIARTLGSKPQGDVRPYRQRAMQGLTETAEGALQTASLPLAATQPEFLPGVAAALPVQQATEAVTSQLPISYEAKGLINTVAPIGTLGLAMHSLHPPKPTGGVAPIEEISKLVEPTPTPSPEPQAAPPAPQGSTGNARVLPSNLIERMNADEQRLRGRQAGALADQTIAQGPQKRPTPQEAPLEAPVPTQAQLSERAPRKPFEAEPTLLESPPQPIPFTPEMKARVIQERTLENLLGEAERGQEQVASQPSPFTVTDNRRVGPESPSDLDFLSTPETPRTPPIRDTRTPLMREDWLPGEAPGFKISDTRGSVGFETPTEEALNRPAPSVEQAARERAAKQAEEMIQNAPEKRPAEREPFILQGGEPKRGVLGNLISGEEGSLDPERLQELALKGAKLLAQIPDKTKWIGEMTSKYGDEIKPYLERTYALASQRLTGQKLEEAATSHPDYRVSKSLDKMLEPSDPHGFVLADGRILSMPFDKVHRSIFESFPLELKRAAIKAPTRGEFENYFLKNTGAARFRATQRGGLAVSIDPSSPPGPGLIDTLKKMASKYGADGITIEDATRPEDMNRTVNIGRDFIERFGTDRAAERAFNEVERKIYGPAQEQGGVTLGSGFGALQPLYDKVSSGASKLKDKLLPEISDRWTPIRKFDPEFANNARVWANAVPHLAETGRAIASDITKGLSPEQNRLLALWADVESRENLRTNHPEEYRAAQNDPAIQAAMDKYRPHMEEINQKREANGGELLQGDYLTRLYDQEPWLRSKSSIDDFITRRNERNVDRTATAEAHYKIGDHDFSKAFTKKYVTENLIEAKNRLFDSFVNSADADTSFVQPGDELPPTIQYKGKTFYSPDLLKKARGYSDSTGFHAADSKLAEQYGIDKDSQPYASYDPNAGRSFGKKSPQLREEAKDGGTILGPKQIVDVLNGLDKPEQGLRSDPLLRWYKSQILGIGFPVHMANILRRVGQETGGAAGVMNPRAWAKMYELLTSSELKERAQNPLDPAAMELREQGSYPSSLDHPLREYWGGNLNPANMLAKANRFGHKMLFDPNFLGGLGGIDQRARIQLHDFLQDRYPEKNATQLASAVDDTLAQYNPKNWSELRRKLAPFLVFPGWDASSMRYVLQHPFRTTVPPAVMVLLANQASYRLGQATQQEAYDPFNIHVAGRTAGLGLVREPLGNALVRAPFNALSAAAQGENKAGIETAAARGLQSTARQAGGMVHPAASALVELGLGAKDLFGGDIASRQDKATGKVLANTGEAIAKHAFPLTSRFLDEGNSFDALSGIGGSLGVPNYAQGPDVTLKRELARASGVRQAFDSLKTTNPEEAKRFGSDYVNRVYVSAYPHLRDAVKKLDRVDDATERARNTLKGEDLNARLKALDVTRQQVLKQAQKINDRIFELKQKGTPAPAPKPKEEPNSFLNSRT